MLVLSRKVQQKIQLGDNIVITILQVKGRSVRIGVEAPADVAVTRPEAVARSRSKMPVEARLETQQRAPEAVSSQSRARGELRGRNATGFVAKSVPATLGLFTHLERRGLATPQQPTKDKQLPPLARLSERRDAWQQPAAACCTLERRG